MSNKYYKICNISKILTYITIHIVSNVLDAGCSTGYRTRKLKDKGFNIIGIAFSDNMIQIASTKNPDISFMVDSCP